MPAKSVAELSAVASSYVSAHFPALKGVKPAQSTRQAKTPGAPGQFIFDFASANADVPQRVRLVLDGEGKVVKVTASR